MQLITRPRIAALALFVLVPTLGAGTSRAATQSNPNACRINIQNYVSNSNAFGVTGAATVDADAKHPSPQPGDPIEPGQTFRLTGATARPSLPPFLQQEGYALNALHEGLNTIQAKVWIALSVTNAVAVGGNSAAPGTQWVGPLDVTATTTIFTSGGEFESATPFQFSDLPVPETVWRAVGGDVALRQAGSGALPPTLPIGPGGAQRAVQGSVVIHSLIGVDGLVFSMDCQPGTSPDSVVIAPAVAEPFDTRDGPLNSSCLSRLGRLASGPDANLPAGQTREIDPIGAQLSATGTAAQFAPGGQYTLTGARLEAEIAAGTASTLGRLLISPGMPEIVPNQDYPLTIWVAIAGANTTQGVQTVRVDTTYRLVPGGAPGTFQPVLIDVALPATTWTATGSAPLSFSAAPPGQMADLQITGGGPGATATYPYTVRPYGSVYLRGASQRDGANLDCSPAAVSVANDAIAFSDLGRLAPPDGSGGRYALVANPVRPAFATATAIPVDPGPGPQDPPRDPEPRPDPPPPESPPATLAALPRPDVALAGNPGRVGSARLVVRGGRVRILVRCARGPSACAGTALLRTAGRVRVGRARRIVTVAPASRYRVTAGRNATMSLRVSGEARRLLRRTRRLRVQITLRPTRGAAVQRTLTLSG